jgi:hypothetical protein
MMLQNIGSNTQPAEEPKDKKNKKKRSKSSVGTVN